MIEEYTAYLVPFVSDPVVPRILNKAFQTAWDGWVNTGKATIEILDEFIETYKRWYEIEEPERRMYYLRGELVGWSYDNVMYLQTVMPSLIQMGILAQRRKVEISFDLPGIEVHKRLRETVNELKSSSESYDALIKSARAKRVRDYFKYRRVSKENSIEYFKSMSAKELHT